MCLGSSFSYKSTNISNSCIDNPPLNIICKKVRNNNKILMTRAVIFGENGS